MTKEGKMTPSRIFKVIGNPKRLSIVVLLSKRPNLSLGEVALELQSNVKTTSAHLACLTESGLVKKSSRGRSVLHALDSDGDKVINILETYFN